MGYDSLNRVFVISFAVRRRETGLVTMQLQATYIGKAARRALEQAPEEATGGGSVLGVTRHGAFLHNGADWIVFLSQEAWRGPLTVNLAVDPGALEALSPGMAFTIEAGRLRFGARAMIMVAGSLPVCPAWQTSAEPCGKGNRERSVLRWNLFSAWARV
jgi:hypothetical protein